MSAASVRLSVDGMTCGHCVGTVQKALEGVGGVRRAEVDLASGVARVDVVRVHKREARDGLDVFAAQCEPAGGGRQRLGPYQEKH